MVTASANFMQENCLTAGRFQNGVIQTLDGPVNDEPCHGSWREECAASFPLGDAVAGKHALIVPEPTDNAGVTRRSGFVARPTVPSKVCGYRTWPVYGLT